MRNYLTFGGVDCRDYGVYISGQGTFSAPARAYENISVPGRNGDLIGSEKRLENLELTYQAFVYANFRENIQAFRSFLLSQTGYKRLADTYHPEEFRMACYAGPFEPEVRQDNKAGRFDIIFNCKPQRFLLSGEQVQTFGPGGDAIRNPTLFDAQPLLRVYGNGTVSIGGVDMTIEDSPYEYVDIDCAMMDAFYGATNCNPYLTLSGNDFPVLAPGVNFILVNDFTRVDITPRWWQL